MKNTPDIRAQHQKIKALTRKAGADLARRHALELLQQNLRLPDAIAPKAPVCREEVRVPGAHRAMAGGSK